MLFTIGSFALHVPMYNHPKINTSEKHDFTFREKKWVVLVAGSLGWSNYRHQVSKSYYICSKMSLCLI